MKHKKTEITEKVNMCWHFMLEFFHFGTTNAGSSTDLKILTQILPNLNVAFVKTCIQTNQNC